MQLSSKSISDVLDCFGLPVWGHGRLAADVAIRNRGLVIHIAVRVISANDAAGIPGLASQMTGFDLSNYARCALIVFNSHQSFVVVFGPHSLSHLVAGVVHFAVAVHHRIEEVALVNLAIVPDKSSMPVEVIVIKITFV